MDYFINLNNNVRIVSNDLKKLGHAMVDLGICNREDDIADALLAFDYELKDWSR